MTATATADPAPKLTAAMPASRFADIEVGRLRPSALNPRRDVGPVDELAASISSQGLVEPLVVHEDAAGGFEVLAGHRRLAAAKAAGISTVPCIVRSGMEPAEKLEMMLVENLQRSDLTPLEEGDAYAALARRHGLSQREIARRVGVTQPTVSRRIKLAGLPKPIRSRIEAGTLTLEDAVEVAKLPDVATMREVLDVAARNTWHSIDVLVKRKLEEIAAVTARAELLEQLRETQPDTVKIIDDAHGRVRTHGKPLSQLGDAVDRDALVAAGDLAVVVDHRGEAVEVCTNPHRYDTGFKASPEATESRYSRSRRLTEAFQNTQVEDLEHRAIRWARVARPADELLADLVSRLLDLTGSEELDVACQTLQLEWARSHTLAAKRDRLRAALADGRVLEVAAGLVAGRRHQQLTDWSGRDGWRDGTIAAWFDALGYTPPRDVQRRLDASRDCATCHRDDEWGLDDSDDSDAPEGWVSRDRCAHCDAAGEGTTDA